MAKRFNCIFTNEAQDHFSPVVSFEFDEMCDKNGGRLLLQYLGDGPAYFLKGNERVAEIPEAKSILVWWLSVSPDAS